MKEAYFTAETLESCTLAFQKELVAYRHKLRGLARGGDAEGATHLKSAPHQAQGDEFCPGLSALLVLDMQGYFLNPDSHAYIPSAAAILPGLKALARAYAAQDLPIVFTQHVNTPDNAGKMSTWWRELIKPEEPRAAILPDFDLSQGIVLKKEQYDAFYQTPLEEILKEKGVRQVVIGGVMTHLCCETTARSAFMRGFDVFFLIDGTATYHRDFHRASLMNLAHGFATLVTVEELLAQGREPDAS